MCFSYLHNFYHILYIIIKLLAWLSFPQGPHCQGRSYFFFFPVLTSCLKKCNQCYFIQYWVFVFFVLTALISSPIFFFCNNEFTVTYYSLAANLAFSEPCDRAHLIHRCKAQHGAHRTQTSFICLCPSLALSNALGLLWYLINSTVHTTIFEHLLFVKIVMNFCLLKKKCLLLTATASVFTSSLLSGAVSSMRTGHTLVSTSNRSINSCSSRASKAAWLVFLT